MCAARNSLPPGYKIHWYIIKDTLGQGGFGITYLAEDTNLNHLVAIKEFLPIEMAVRESDASVHPVTGEQGDDYRWGLERFISEAQTLARFRHPNIVRVMTVFTENNTAYMIMEYEQGKGLHEELKIKGRLPEQEIMQIFMPILDGLEHVHAAGFIHRDIKPPNIYIRDDGSPVLLDFGSARQSLGRQTRTLTTLVSPGYAPFEQYVSKSDKQGPWTDIYGLGATMYRAVTGKSPPNAVDRSEAILHTGQDIYVPVADICRENYSTVLLRAIDHALAFKADERPADIVTWRREITGEIDPGSNEGETEETVQAQIQPDTNEIQTVRITAAEVAETGMESDEHTVKPEEPGWVTHIIKYIKRLIWATVAVAGIIVLVNLTGKQKGTSPREAPDTGSEISEPPDVKSVTTDITRTRAEPDARETTPDTAADTAVPRQTKSEPLISSRSTRTPVPELLQTPDLINSSDQRRLATLRERLRANPNDQTSARQLRTMLNDYNKKIKDTLDEGDLPKAEAYIKQVLELAPDNKRLEKALEKIREARANKE